MPAAEAGVVRSKNETSTSELGASLMKVTINADIPSADCFRRAEPAALELSPDQLRVATQVIDYAGALVVSAKNLRTDHRVRDLMSSALLRRAIVTSEGIRVLLMAGLMEPATACHRTLLDIEIALNLVLRDDTDRSAHRLAVSCAQDYQAHGEGILSDKEAREASAHRLAELRRVSAEYKRLTNSPVFDEVRKEVSASQYWHGFKSVREAFKSLGRGFDYAVQYDGYSWFVHGVNVEHDLSAPGPEGPSLRAFVERDPKHTSAVLGLALHKLLEIAGLILVDRGHDPSIIPGGRATLQREDGTEETINSLQFLQFLLLAHFDIREDAPIRSIRPVGA